MILNELSVSPNPTKDILKVSLGKVIRDIINVEIYSVLGQKIYIKNISNLDELSIDFTGFQSGTYILKVTLNEEIVNKLIIKN